MCKRRLAKNELEKSFTLIELLVVISIITLLSSVVLASLSQAKLKGIVAAGQLFESVVNAKIGDGLVAEYNFDEQAGSTIIRDSSGTGMDMINYNNPSNPVSKTTGVSGSALKINSSGGVVVSQPGVLTNRFDPQFDYQKGSISFWVRPEYFFNASPSQTPIMSFQNSGDNEPGMRLWLSFQVEKPGGFFPGIFVNDNGQWNWNNNVYWDTGVSSDSLLRRWNHVLITWKTVPAPASISLYLNGKFVNTTVVTNLPFFAENTVPFADALFIGGDRTTRHGEMSIDRVRIYNKYFELK